MPTVNRATPAGATFEIVSILAFNYVAALSAHNAIVCDLLHVKSISLNRLGLCVHEIAQDELFDAVADGVHAAGIFHLIAAFEILGDAIDLGILTDEQVVGFLRVAVQIGQILLERSFHSHNVDNSEAFLLQVVVVGCPQTPTRAINSSFTAKSSFAIPLYREGGSL